MQSKVVAMKRAAWGAPVAVLLMCGSLGAALPIHAFADTAMPVGGNFAWQVQLPDGSSEAGLSADLSSAIALAEIGVPPAYDTTIQVALTQQAQQLGVPMTAVAAPSVAAPTPAPAASSNVDTNDQAQIDAGANGN